MTDVANKGGFLPSNHQLAHVLPVCHHIHYTESELCKVPWCPHDGAFNNDFGISESAMRQHSCESELCLNRCDACNRRATNGKNIESTKVGWHPWLNHNFRVTSCSAVSIGHLSFFSQGGLYFYLSELFFSWLPEAAFCTSVLRRAVFLMFREDKMKDIYVVYVLLGFVWVTSEILHLTSSMKVLPLVFIWVFLVGLFSRYIFGVFG